MIFHHQFFKSNKTPILTLRFAHNKITMLTSILNTLTSLLLPFSYILTLFTIYSVYSKLTRNKQVLIKKDREIYFELSNLYSPHDMNGRRLLCSCLLKWCVSCIKQSIEINSEKGPLHQMVKNGTISADLLSNLNIQEENINLELAEISNEAELIKLGWKDSIFQEANTIAQYQIKLETDIQDQVEQAVVPSFPEEEDGDTLEIVQEDQEAVRRRSAEELIAQEEAEKEEAATLKKKRNKKVI